MIAVDLFAGPGGWDEGIRPLGIEPLGIELDDAACATRAAAGHRTLQADVATLEPADFAPCDLLIASPPCTSFSYAGLGKGRAEIDRLFAAVRTTIEGGPIPSSFADPTSPLVLEPARWVAALRPPLLAFEQVPPVLPLWEQYALQLEQYGYRAWTGCLQVANYGVPQTRERAILLAAQRERVEPPAPTHARDPGESLFDQRLPWVSMATALGWPSDSEVRQQRGAGMIKRYGEPPNRRADEPSFTLTEKVRSWIRMPGSGNGGFGRPRHVSEPAPSLAFGKGGVSTRWLPSADTDRTSADAVPVEVWEAAVLQGFPADYPFQGSRTTCFRQIGNAVPPPFGRAVIAALVGAEVPA